MCCHQPAPDVSSEEEHAFDEAAYEDSDTVTETEEEHVCIRAKCTIDDAKTIDEAVEKLNEFIAYLKTLKEEGWELREPISDDYGFLYKS